VCKRSAKLRFICEIKINSVVGATIGRPPKNGLKSTQAGDQWSPLRDFYIAKHPDKSKFEERIVIYLALSVAFRDSSTKRGD